MILVVVFLIILLLLLLPRYKSPRVMENVLTDQERKYIIRCAKDKLEDSKVTTGKIVNETIRKSKTAWLSKTDPIIQGVIEKCIRHTNKTISECENLQVLKYESGGHYRAHQDCFDTDKNKRMYTFILALNDGYEGGETYFPILEKRYKLKMGDALFFNTLDTHEKITPKALHGGLHVKSGEKWICNLWVRKYPYVY